MTSLKFVNFHNSLHHTYALVSPIFVKSFMKAPKTDCFRTMLDDALDGKFLSSNGMDGFMLTNLCSGMGPSSLSVISPGTPFR